MSEPRGKVTVTACGLTDMGKVRGNNEDAFLIADLAGASAAPAPTGLQTFDATEHAVLLAVSDGMGGADAGEVASALVVESLRRAMSEVEGMDWDEATKQAVQRANREVWSAARAPGRRGMGATVTAVCLQGDHAHIAEVGDSRAYLLRNGRIRQVTRDQSFVQYLVDAGALKPEDAANYPMKNVVLQAMGQSPDVQVALGRLELRRGDKLLLCSDGLSGKLSNEEMLARVQQNPSLEAACGALVELANEHGGDDNITVILVRVDGDGLKIPQDQESLTQTFQVLAEYKAAAMGLGFDDDDKDEDEGDDVRDADPAGDGLRVPTPGPSTPPPERAAAGAGSSPAGASRPAPAKAIDLKLIASAVALGVALGLVAVLLQRL